MLSAIASCDESFLHWPSCRSSLPKLGNMPDLESVNCWHHFHGSKVLSHKVRSWSPFPEHSTDVGWESKDAKVSEAGRREYLDP